MIAHFVWTCFKEILGWDRIPTGLDDLFENWVYFGCVDYSLKLFCFTIVAWVLWPTRNKSRIEHVFPKSPIAIVYKTDSLLQSWKILLRRPDQKKAEDFRGRTADWMKTFVTARSRPDESDWC